LHSVGRTLLLLALAALILYVTEGGTMADTSKSIPFPADTEGWRLAGGTQTHTPETVFKYMNGAAELYLAYNMEQVTTGRYDRPDQPSIIVEVFRMASPEDAYGVFSFEQQDPPAGIGQGSEFGGGLLRFWKGPYFVTAFAEGPAPGIDDAVLALGGKLASAVTVTGNPPKIVSYAPKAFGPFTLKKMWFLRSHILLNQRFFIAHANLLALGPTVDALLARYEGSGQTVFLAIAGYPAPSKAQSAASTFTKAYMAGGSDGLVKTENNRWTGLERRGRFVVIAFDAPDPATAKGLMEAAEAALPKEGE
jgi:hypothetical protein